MKINLEECTNNKIKYLESLPERTNGMSLVMYPVNSWAEIVNKCACSNYSDEETAVVLQTKKGPKI
ncbi:MULTISPECIES: hypothetical protein [Spiroplasma]|uniref:hypothetical protein n=1 Tax=Spiroplasma TaxID=2132 RepID=UPI002575814B|nr:hypothetical protein [Spiroplasma ixodetis]WJG69981.1 hypothetical protein SIXOD_v1c09900 [Spiroplasma ixodetis Y32]